jgi:hypothetical protein
MRYIQLYENFEATNDVAFFSVQHGLQWLATQGEIEQHFVDAVLNKIHSNRITVANLENIMKEEGASPLNIDKYVKAAIYSEKDKDLRELVPAKPGNKHYQANDVEKERGYDVHGQAIEEEMTDDAKDYISRKIKFLRDEGKPENQAVAMAYSYARKKGFKVPQKK